MTKTKLDDDSVLTTKWFFIFYIPILPLRSYQMLEEGKAISSSKWVFYYYDSNEKRYWVRKAKMDLGNVIPQLFFIYSIILSLILVCYLIMHTTIYSFYLLSGAVVFILSMWFIGNRLGKYLDPYK